MDPKFPNVSQIFPAFPHFLVHQNSILFPSQPAKRNRKLQLTSCKNAESLTHVDLVGLEENGETFVCQRRPHAHRHGCSERSSPSEEEEKRNEYCLAINRYIQVSTFRSENDCWFSVLNEFCQFPFPTRSHASRPLVAY